MCLMCTQALYATPYAALYAANWTHGLDHAVHCSKGLSGTFLNDLF